MIRNSLLNRLASLANALKQLIRKMVPVCPVKLLGGLFKRQTKSHPLESVLNAKTPPSEDNPLLQDLLDDLQANILKGHGRNFARHIFLRFKPGSQLDARIWIAELAKHNLTSAKQQSQQARSYRSLGFDGGIFAHLALSNDGYEYLGVPAEKRPVPTNPQKRGDEIGYTNVFADGMKSRQDDLLDPPVDTWDSGYQQAIHALIILASDNERSLDRAEGNLIQSVEPIAEVCAREVGKVLYREFQLESGAQTLPVEHFGNVDGLSQPCFFAEQLECGKRNFDSAAHLSLVLVQDPMGNDQNSFGSFLAFRKLEQNVKGFDATLEALANEIGMSKSLASAMAIGRFQDGTPVVESDKDGKGPGNNTFNFSDDRGGLRCPFQSHIRKTNPRGESVSDNAGLDKTLEQERGHRIARRGITYGGNLSDFNNPESLPEKGVGLLFMCYQSDPVEQFEFIQRRWSNNPYFVKPMLEKDSNYDVTGLDPLVGQKHPTAKGAAKAPANWPIAWDRPTRKVKTELSGFITMKGGEYFFSPSLSGLRSLANTDT